MKTLETKTFNVLVNGFLSKKVYNNSKFYNEFKTEDWDKNRKSCFSFVLTSIKIKQFTVEKNPNYRIHIGQI